MDPGDVANVLARERRTFSREKWDEEALREEVEHNARSRWFVYEDGVGVRGHVGCWILPDRLHITTIAVDREVRRNGIARRLMNAMHGSLDHDRPFQLEVRESNTPARTLYDGLGYRNIGRKPSYYSDNQEDAIVMERRKEEGNVRQSQ